MNREGIKVVTRREDGEKETDAIGGLAVMGGLGWWTWESLVRRLGRFSRLGG
jgi:hypothetical protein